MQQLRIKGGEKENLRRMYEVDGMLLREIADYYKVSIKTIYCRLHPEKRKIYKDKFNREYPEYAKEWRLKNPEYDREWQLAHPGYKKEYNNQWLGEHPGYASSYFKQWRLEHPEYGTEYIKQWRQTPKGKAYRRKENANRRNLGSVELNKSFSGSEGHHIDETHIIHIPKELHKSIRHNVHTGQGMEAINEIAFRYNWEA